VRILAKGWQLAALGGNSVALEWGDPAAGLWVQRLLGCHPFSAACVPVAVYRLHTDPVERGLTVFGGTDCLYRGSDPAGGANAVMEAMMQVWTRSCRDGLMLHAALMSKRGRGLMIGGVSGAGKSSLAAWFIRQGWTYHGDEQMYADANDRHWEGYVRPLCFKGDWASMFRALVTRSESVAKVGGQTLVAANVFGQEVTPELSVRPGIMLFPTFRKGSDFSLKRLPAGQAAIRLVQSILNGGNLIHRGVAQAAGMARACPGYDVTYGHFDQLAPLLQLLDVSGNEAQP
jgi:hypothetical protein